MPFWLVLAGAIVLTGRGSSAEELYKFVFMFLIVILIIQSELWSLSMFHNGKRSWSEGPKD